MLFKKEGAAGVAQKDETIVNTGGVRLIIASQLGAASNLFLMLMMFTTYVATGSYGITVVAAGSIVAAMGIWDAVTDPIIAWFVPNIRTRIGVARPVILGGYAIEIVAVLMMFKLCVGKGVIAFVISYMLHYIGSTMMNQGGNLMRNMLTNNPRQRPLIARYNQYGTMIISMVFQLVQAKILYPKYGAINMAMMQEIAVYCTVGAGILVLGCCWAGSASDNVDKFTKSYSQGATKFRISDVLNLILHNRAFLMQVISEATDKLASTASSNSAISMLLFGVIIGNYAWSGTLSIYKTIGTIAMVTLATAIGRSKGNKVAYLRFCWISIIVSALTVITMLIFDPTKLGASLVPTVIFIVLYSIMGGFKATTNACVMSMYMDIVDYEFYTHDKYMGPLVKATGAIFSKIVASAASVIVAFMLASIGYKDTMPQQGDPSTPAVFWIVMLVWLGFPVLGYVASIIAMKWYPLDSEMMKKVQEGNRIKREKNTQAYVAETAQKS